MLNTSIITEIRIEPNTSYGLKIIIVEREVNIPVVYMDILNKIANFSPTFMHVFTKVHKCNLIYQSINFHNITPF